MHKGVALKGDLCPWFYKTTGGLDLDTKWLASLRQLARTATDAGFLEELRGNPEKAADWYMDGLRMGDQMRRGVMLQCLVGIALQIIARDSLDRLMANAELPADKLRQIRDASLQAIPKIDDVRNAMDREEEWSCAMTGNNFGMQVAKMVSPYGRSLKAARRELDTPLWELSARNQSPAGAKNNPYGALRFQFGRLEAQLRLTALHAALRLYINEHGAPPDALEALVPDFLPALPIDPFTGTSLRYVRSKGDWTAWSVGENGIDEDGAKAILDDGAGGIIRVDDISLTSDMKSNLHRRNRGQP